MALLRIALGLAGPTALAAALAVGAPLALAQDGDDAEGNPDVIVDYSVLDYLGSSAATDAEPLPAPDQPPVSRMLVSPETGLLIRREDEAPSDETFSAVPTTPIDAIDLLSASEDDAGGATIDTDIGTELGDLTVDDADATSDASAAEAATDEASTVDAVETASTGEADGAATPDGTAMADGQLRIEFDQGSDIIPETVKGSLVAIVTLMRNNPDSRLLVLAYAEGGEDEASRARGISLARALKMRRFFTTQGIHVSRLDLRAFGNTAQEQPFDRVDLIPQMQ